MKALAALLGSIDRLSQVSGKLTAALAVPMVVCLVYEVFARYLFNSPTIWSYDVTYMIYGAHYILGAAFTYHVKGHIRIDVFYNLFPEKARNIIDLVAYVIIIIPVTYILAINAFDIFKDAWISKEVSQYSPWMPVLWPVKGSMFIGFTLLFLQCAADFVRTVVLAVKGEQI